MALCTATPIEASINNNGNAQLTATSVLHRTIGVEVDNDNDYLLPVDEGDDHDAYATQRHDGYSNDNCLSTQAQMTTMICCLEA